MSSPKSSIYFYLLGRFEIVREGQTLRADGWPRRKAAALIKYLAIQKRLVKDQAIDLFWPESDLDSGANNLYRTIHALRQTLHKSLGPDSAELIFGFENGILSFNETVWVDVNEFERLCSLPTGSQLERITSLEKALALYEGDLLPDDLYAEWTLTLRESLRRQQREASLALAALYIEVRQYDGAFSLLKPLLEYDPADEPVHRELMRAYALTGRRHDALRQYRACVDALAAELDVSPAPETDALYSQILNGEVSPPSSPIIEVNQGRPFPDVDVASRVDKPRPLFVGRERELNVLQSHLQEAIAGNGRVVFITGEAGQGKTSLMAEFAHRAQLEHPELVVAAGACQALTGISDPYLPFRDLIAMLSGDWQRPWLRGDISVTQMRRLQTIAPRTVKAIANFAPDLTDIIGFAAGLHKQRMPSSRNLEQPQVFEQMRRLIHALAADQPLLLLLDDLQWIDNASASLLFYLARQLTKSRVLILGAYRPSEVSHSHDPSHPLEPIIQELIRYQGDIQVDLGTLGSTEGRNFVDVLLDSEPNRLDATFREEMFRRTNGNPLFTVELLRALQEQSALVRDEAGMWTVISSLDWDVLPVRIEAVIARRIDRLPPELRQMLAVASVEGEIFSAQVIAQVQGLPVRSLLNQLSQDLDRHYRLVREQGEMQLGGQSIARYQFSHNLFQQYLYHQLSTAERQNLHAEIAAALEQIGRDHLDRLAVTLAHHYLAAGDSAQAVPYLCRAGDDAKRRVALVEAIQFYQSALTHWQADDPDAQAEVLHKLGVSYLALGNSVEAIERFSEAHKLYAQVGNASGMGAMQRLMGRSYYEQGERAKATNHYHGALSLLEGEPDNAELARVIGAISQMHMSSGEYDEAVAWGERALSLARAADTEDVILHALTTVGVSLANRGEAERGLVMLAESQQRAEALGLPHDAGRAYAGWTDALVTLERYEDARALYEQMLAYAQKAQTGMFEGVALVQLGYLDWWAGRWRQALARRQEIVDWIAAFPGSSFAKVWASNFLGLMYNDLGQTEQARAVLTEYAAVARSAHEPQTTVPHLGQLARCAQSEGHVAELVQEILSLTDSASYPQYESLPALRLACGWLAQSSGGDINTLRRLEKANAQMQNRQSLASLDEVRAVAAGSRGEWGQAVSHYRSAVANWEALQRPYDLLRTLAGLGKALVHIDDAAALKSVHHQTASLIEQLASELDDPELKQAFLISPLVREIQR